MLRQFPLHQMETPWDHVTSLVVYSRKSGKQKTWRASKEIEKEGLVESFASLVGRETLVVTILA